jgi:hypothetical protein
MCRAGVKFFNKLFTLALDRRQHQQEGNDCKTHMHTDSFVFYNF